MRRAVVAALAVLLTLVVAAPAAAQSPTAITLQPESVTDSSARLRATVGAADAGATARFEYGLPGAFDKSLGVVSGATGAPRTVSVFVNDLAPATTYEYRIAVTDDDETARGATVSFTTSAGKRPEVDVRTAEAVSATTIGVLAHVDPHVTRTRLWVEHGPTPALGQRTAEVEVPAGAQGTRTFAIGDLQPATTTYLEVVATNAAGETRSGVRAVATRPELASVRHLVSDAVSYGSRARVTAQLGGRGLGGLPVLLQTFDGGTWKDLGAGTVDAQGRWRFVTPRVTAPLFLRVAAKALPPLTSQPRTLGVRPRVASTVRTAGRRRAVVQATITPQQRGQRAALQRLVGARWTTVARKAVAGGRARFAVARGTRRAVVRIVVTPTARGWVTAHGARRVVAAQ
ncbi:hypothetical protein [Conexibacter sp. SYSU D00693]|uniref:hypothetical protein n=1 Tax=Conexibacter sp. SYSU D00693 TaxID=2812560 RepID=UPI00196AF1FC|nr:hypothetical protein [Conexibacter sp. SYSU D00693]